MTLHDETEVELVAASIHNHGSLFSFSCHNSLALDQTLQPQEGSSEWPSDLSS
ncbi:hypothetical protein Fmac_025708 [Flemingia macrophylla]|uniref:Uncharacterized protein n=1 Tax=Flemingia macrophylla TaxID=520843 RepID=A0ABD1LT20_9FABA